MRVLKSGCLSLLIMVCGVTFAATDETLSARAGVESFHAKLLDVMQQADSLGFSGRYDALAPEIDSRFDVPYIAALVTGRYWRELDESQQTLMIETFQQLTIATYASRFDGYSGEQFKILETKPLNNQRVLVRTALNTTNRGDVSLDYVLHEVESDWRIVNVIADGVSELSIKRADYAGVLTTEGFDALISKIRTQIQNLQTTTE